MSFLEDAQKRNEMINAMAHSNEISNCDCEAIRDATIDKKTAMLSAVCDSTDDIHSEFKKANEQIANLTIELQKSNNKIENLNNQVKKNHKHDFRNSFALAVISAIISIGFTIIATKLGWLLP